ncbi:T6SS phospholipase effector Tle1-like catalytic domain-containing protein [Sulfurimonas lithotrophica]|nr:DUF2235 domain-containing protein [Sulfurimonas lithotrophica]
MSKPFSIGTVVYNGSEFMSVAKVLSNEEVSSTSHDMCVPRDEYNHWAYLIVGYEESKSLRTGVKEDKKILENIKNKYIQILKSAIESTEGKIQSNGYEIDNKLVYHQISGVKSTKNLKHFLQSEKFTCQAKKLKDSENSILQSRMYLKLTNQEANQLLQKEYDTLNPDQKKKVHAYAFVAMPYTYSNDKLKLNSEAVFVAFMPRVQFEAGVFFDGTLNNMYNTNLRVDFEKYTQAQVDVLGGFSSQEKISTNGPKRFLEGAPKEEVLEKIQTDLKKSINFYKNGIGDSKLKDYVEKSAKGASEELYAYFEDVLSRKASSVEEFVKEELLPDKGSYQNDQSNIAILHSLYDTNIKDSKSKGEFFRKSIYITGAGSYNPYLKKEHESDALLGKALGMGETGVLAKVNQACKFIKESIEQKNLSYIDTLVFDVFGFSRGAAEARHFVNSIADELDLKLKNDNKEFVLYKKDGSNLYPYLIKEIEGKKDEVIIDKIVFRFVGIFDTVSHYGLYQEDDKEDELNLVFDDTKISNVLHLVAKDEYRENFALTKLQTNVRHFEEKSFHGAHSDIGGGYIDGKDEKIQLYKSYNIRENSLVKTKKSLESKLKKWNKKYRWLQNDLISYKYDVKDGFYIQITKRIRGSHRNVSYTLSAWMIRSSVSSEYSKIPLEYMHKKLKELKIPFTSLGTHKVTDSILKQNQQKIVNLDENTIKSIRAKYFHHSSDLSGVGMDGADAIDDSEFYGKRVVY